jgi:hypothetical protein
MHINPGRALRRLVSAALVFGTAAPALAQTGGTADVASPSQRAPAQPPHTVILTTSFFGGSSDPLNGSTASGLIVDGPYADADLGLSYLRRKGRASFGLNGRSVLRRTEIDLMPMLAQGGFEFAVAGLRQQFRASETIGRTPNYQFGNTTEMPPMSLGETAQAHGDLANADLEALASTTDIEWNRSLGQRFAFSTEYYRRQTMFAGQPELDMTMQRAGATLTRRMTRFVALKSGYTHRIARTAAGVEPTRGHDLDLGVDYSRPLSMSGRTLVSFATGSSITPQDDALEVRMTGDAAVTRMIGRTWNARTSFNRSVNMLEGFADPVLANTFNASLGGSLQRRVSVSSWTSLSTGEVGLTGEDGNGYSNWSAGAGLSILIGHRGSIEAHYFYVGDEFEENVQLPPGLSHQARERQGVRIGFTWRGPLVGR